MKGIVWGKLSENRFIILTLLLASSVRIAWIFLSAGSPTFAKYFRLGEKLAAVGWKPDIVFASSPLYIYLVGFVTKVLGFQETGLRVIQAVAAVATIYLVWRIVGFLASAAAAKVSALILALYPTLILCETQPVPFVWVNLTNAAVLFFLLRNSERHTPVNQILAGFFLGLSALLRPNILLFVPLAFVGLLLLGKKEERKKRMQAMAVIMLVCAVVISPISLINRAAGGEFTLVTASGGSTMHLGNNPANDNPLFITPTPLGKQLESSMNQSLIKQPITREHLALRKAAGWVAGKRLTPGGASDLYTKEVISYAWRQPGAYLRGIAGKMRHFFHYFESHDTKSAYVRSVIMKMPFAPVFVIVWTSALWGVFVSRKHWEKYFPVYALFAVYFASSVIFYITSRLRLPVLLPVSILAGVGLHDLYLRIRERNKKAVCSFLVMGTVFTVFSAWPTASVKQAGKIINFNIYFEPGAEEFFRGDRSTGMEYFYKAAAAYPEAKSAVIKILSPYSGETSVQTFLSSLDNISPTVIGDVKDREIRKQFSLGNIEYKRGNYRSAIKHFNRVTSLSPYDWGALHRRSLCFKAIGNWSQALSDLESSFEYGGKWQNGIHKRYYEMAQAAVKTGELAKAGGYIRRSLFVDDKYFPAQQMRLQLEQEAR